MTPRPVSLVPAGVLATPAQRAAAAIHTAQLEAGAHVQQLVDAMEVCERLAREVAAGGELYPAGIRDMAGRHAVACSVAIKHIHAVGAR